MLSLLPAAEAEGRAHCSLLSFAPPTTPPPSLSFPVLCLLKIYTFWCKSSPYENLVKFLRNFCLAPLLVWHFLHYLFKEFETELGWLGSQHREHTLDL